MSSATLPGVMIRQRGPNKKEAIVIPDIAWFSVAVFDQPEACAMLGAVWDAAKRIITLNVINGPIRYGVPDPPVEKDGAVMAVLLDAVEA